ncbi:MAG: epimerase, partial [Desulfuromonas sp.]
EGLAVMIDWIKARGPRPFLHNVELEIDGPLAPKVWSKKIL